MSTMSVSCFGFGRVSEGERVMKRERPESKDGFVSPFFHSFVLRAMIRFGELSFSINVTSLDVSVCPLFLFFVLRVDDVE